MDTQTYHENTLLQLTDDDLFEVRRRRMLAFLVDYFIIALLVVASGFAVGVLGILTFGLAWLLYGILVPFVALGYITTTMASPTNATIGMRIFAIRVETLDGKDFDWMMAVVHTVLFWVIHVFLTPFALLASLFSSKKRLLHDLLLGTVYVYRPDER